VGAGSARVCLKNHRRAAHLSPPSMRPARTPNTAIAGDGPTDDGPCPAQRRPAALGRGETVMTAALGDKTCAPHRGGVPPLTHEEAEAGVAAPPFGGVMSNRGRLVSRLDHRLTRRPLRRVASKSYRAAADAGAGRTTRKRGRSRTRSRPAPWSRKGRGAMS
jgi:hypothetical protein